MAPIPRLRPYAGPALFSYGFRPFFLFGSVYAGVAGLAWLAIFTGELTLLSAFAPRDWHVAIEHLVHVPVARSEGG